MQNLKKILLGMAVVVIGSAAHAASGKITLHNNSEETFYVKYDLLNPVTDVCKANFPSDNQFNVVVAPKATVEVGPYASDCHIVVSASSDNKFYNTCANGKDVTAGFSVELNAEDMISSCEVKK